MQKWEHVYVEVVGNKVIRINNQSVGDAGFLALLPKGEMIGDFINRMGKEGWEAVSMFGDHPSSDLWVYILLKRPID